MIKFNEQAKIDSVNGALALRPQINEFVDEICERGYSNICWLGVGGTWASAMQAYGAFVDLGNGVSGLVHISQICEKRIRKPSEVLSVGDKVKVKVIAIKDGKLSLSIKEASDLMAKEVEEESFELPESGEEATTSLGALFANIKL